ncbi:hypothetical protein XGA_0186 [Xanthomonas hortorum ATCC 19865]|nr:hypothetical protein XGA_0186 [Xanthomonas hortorum ATCC 19865]
MKLYRDQDLTRGIASQQGPRPRVRQPIMLTQTARKTEAGRYMLELYAKRRPTRAFWVEAVSSERKVVLAQRWITPKTSAWTIWHWSRKRLSQTAPELRRCTGIRRAPLLLGAAAQRWLLGAASRDVFCRPLQDHEISVALKRLDNMIDRSAMERMIFGLAAGPLPAHHRGTRRKYVRVGSYAASMPRKVPRRWAGKDQSR